MATFDVFVFLLHSFVPTPIRLESMVIQPFEGTGIEDVADLIDRFASTHLEQPPQPEDQRAAMSQRIANDGASVVITVKGIDAPDFETAAKQTEGSVLLLRDILALRQKHRGQIAGFLGRQTDVEPALLFSHVRRPYPILPKVWHLSIGETEADVYSRLLAKAQSHSKLAVYLSLYADSLCYSDTYVTDIGMETRLLKTWSFLETMAISEAGRKKQKVKALFARFSLRIKTDYQGHAGHDLIDTAYGWRNVIAHSGGCKAAASAKDVRFCAQFGQGLQQLVDDLSNDAGFVLYAYAASLP